MNLDTTVPDFSIPFVNPQTGQIDYIWFQFMIKLLDRTTASTSSVLSVSGSTPIVSSGGATPAISILAASVSNAGSMSAADKAKLNSMSNGAAVASVSGTAPITSTGGASPTIAITNATISADGAMSALDKVKLNGIGTGATVTGVTGTAPIVSSGGAAPAISITNATTSADGSMTAADKTKLNGIGTGATVVSVTGTAPIVSSGGANPALSINAATTSTAGSMSAADKTKLDGLVIANMSNFMVHQTVSQSVVGGVPLKATFTTKDFDDLTEYDTATSRFICNNTGTYVFAAGVVGSQATLVRRQLAIYVNAVMYQIIQDAWSTGPMCIAGSSAPIKLNAFDQVSVEYYSDQPETTTTGKQNTYFGGWRIK